MSIETGLVLTGAAVWLAVLGVAGGAAGVAIGEGLRALCRRIRRRRGGVVGGAPVQVVRRG